MAYVWAETRLRQRRRRASGRRALLLPQARRRDRGPGTGSACANLGGWLIATGAPLPQRFAIAQGDRVGRPCRLGLEVTAERKILVSGRVIELGRGTVTL